MSNNVMKNSVDVFSYHTINLELRNMLKTNFIYDKVKGRMNYFIASRVI